MLCGAAPLAPVRYALSPVISGRELTAVAVEIRLVGDESGETKLDLPDGFGGVKNHWRYLTNLQVDGASVDATAPAERALRHAPGAPLTIRYRVTTAYASDPTGDDGNPYKGAVIRPAWFAALGDFVFAKPEGRDDAPATFAWRGWPAGWTHISDADHGSMGRAMTVGDVIESTLLAGPDVALRTRPIPGGALRLATRGRWDWSLEDYADTMGRILSTERDFWGDVSGPFTVTLFQLAPGKNFSSFGGTGRGDGFAQYASPDIAESVLVTNVAHENIHTWIPGRIGEMPEGRAEASLFWLSEGFTEFYTARTLLHAGVWTPGQFVDDLNGKLGDYARSPARSFPNARIATDFWTDPAVQQLAYRRGELFAYLLDRELRHAGHAQGLETVLFAMRDHWVAAPAGGKPALLANFNAAMGAAGVSARDDLARFIDAGEPIDLAPDQFAGCATVATVTIPSFDVGFDRDASAKAGVFAGVDPNGPAYAAGLRDGMKRLARLGGQEGDSRVPLAYKVEASGVQRVISWRPEGKGRLTLQEVKLTPDLSDAQRAACARTMSP
jgi:predicted metalloprotease with PDZ domain